MSVTVEYTGKPLDELATMSLVDIGAAIRSNKRKLVQLWLAALGIGICFFVFQVPGLLLLALLATLISYRFRRKLRQGRLDAIMVLKCHGIVNPRVFKYYLNPEQIVLFSSDEVFTARASKTGTSYCTYSLRAAGMRPTRVSPPRKIKSVVPC